MFIDDDYFDDELESLLSEYGFAGGELDTEEEKQAKKDFMKHVDDDIIWEWF